MSFPTCPPRTSVATHAWPGASPHPRLSAPISVRLDSARALVTELLALDAAGHGAGDEFWQEWAAEWLAGRASFEDTVRAVHEAGAFASGVRASGLPDSAPVLAFARARAAVVNAAVSAEREHRDDPERRRAWGLKELLARQRIDHARAVSKAPRRIP